MVGSLCVLQTRQARRINRIAYAEVLPVSLIPGIKVIDFFEKQTETPETGKRRIYRTGCFCTSGTESERAGGKLYRGFFFLKISDRRIKSFLNRIPTPWVVGTDLS